MPQDAFTLRHIARELDGMLSGGKVNKIIQPSRDEVDLLLYAGGKTRKLLLNTNASFASSPLPSTARGNFPARSAYCTRRSWASTPTSCSQKTASSRGR